MNIFIRRELYIYIIINRSSVKSLRSNTTFFLDHMVLTLQKLRLYTPIILINIIYIFDSELVWRMQLMIIKG